MKHELIKHLTPLVIVLFITSIFWILTKTAWYNFAILSLGLVFGSFFLDTDHLIYWYYTHQNLEESRLAQITIKKHDFRGTLTLLEAVHKKHIELIFHNFIFHLILLALSIFAFTSTDSIFGKSFLLALNVHLFVDELEDFRNNPTHLQLWLFARLPKQFPINFIKKFLAVVAILILIFVFLLIRSK